MLNFYFLTHPDGRQGAVIAPTAQIARQTLAERTSDPGWHTGPIQHRAMTGDPAVIYVDPAPVKPSRSRKKAPEKEPDADRNDESDGAGRD